MGISKKRLLTIFAFCVSIISCTENNVVSEKEKAEVKDSQSTITIESKMEREKQYAEKECEVLKMYLDDKHYVYPTRDEFKKRCSEFWGIDVDTIPYVYNPDGDDQLFTDCMIFRCGSESVYYYPSYETQIKGDPKNDANEALAAMKYADDSLDYCYNQLLFHDDIRTLPKFLNNPEHAYNVVYYHNYEKNKLLLQKAASEYSWPDERFWSSLRYTLFYNNLGRGIRKEFIKQITHFKNEKPEKYDIPRRQPDFCDLIYMYIDVFDYIDVPIDLKDECLCYMVLLLEDFCNEFNKKNSCGEAYGAADCLAYMVKMYGYDFIERIEKKNYYRNSKLKELIESGMYHNLPFDDPNKEGIIDEGYAILWGRIEDKDGYVNLRASADLKSNIIGTIPSGEDVRFTDMTQDEIWGADMLKVRTKDGRIGYVHKSRIRMYLMRTDENRKSCLESYHLPYIKEYEW